MEPLYFIIFVIQTFAGTKGVCGREGGDKHKNQLIYRRIHQSRFYEE